MGLRDVRVQIPNAVKRGDNALLICNYDMEEDSLYSIKWYKGKREFYRYTPKEPQSIKTFPVAGITVEVKSTAVKREVQSSSSHFLFSIDVAIERIAGRDIASRHKHVGQILMRR